MILISAAIALMALCRVLVSKRLSRNQRGLLSVALALAVATSWVSIVGDRTHRGLARQSRYSVVRDLRIRNSSRNRGWHPRTCVWSNGVCCTPRFIARANSTVALGVPQNTG